MLSLPYTSLFDSTAADVLDHIYAGDMCVCDNNEDILTLFSAIRFGIITVILLNIDSIDLPEALV